MFVYKQVIFENYQQEVRSSLEIIFGVGKYKSNYICSRLGLIFPFYLGSLNNYYISLLINVLDYFSWLEVRIKRMIFLNIKKIFNNNSYKGLRHKDSLPVRGQRTRTNAHTKKRYKIILTDE